MRVSDIMTKEVITVSKETPLKEAASLLAKFHIHAMPVINDSGKITGIITESDFFSKDASNIYLPTFLEFLSKNSKITKKPEEPSNIEKIRLVRDVMTAECITVQPDLSLKELVALIKHKGFKTLPVVDDQDTLVGIVSVIDIIKLL